MGAFMYFGLVLTTVLFIGGPLVLFRLMLETVAARSQVAESETPPTARSLELVRYTPPASGSMPLCV